ncbi:hypothetical protein K435DRAFT_963661 [Dendrothele bispora CBS 962.96]|uniref:Family A G protein-coupled receptor-like protein n=1 Tax=Dendrothele bispora (strain CBS 962.96) TaxID=1314807 RepID=A0A4S8MER8_DENBC|nr:hypothetical protein K435DRAFT_963661 [Dendrothele bispora CBS 962.96]
MSSSPDALVNTVANSLAQDSVQLIVDSAAWGFYALLFIIAVCIQCATGLKHWNKRLMFGLTCLLFCSSTVLWGINITYLRATNMFLIGPLDSQSMANRAAQATNIQSSLAAPIEALYLFNMFVGDILVLWRSYIICDRNKLIFVLPCLTLLTSLGFAVGSIVCLETHGTSGATSMSSGSKVCAWSEPIAWAASLLTNILSTSAVAFRMWGMRGLVKQSLGYLPPYGRAQRILMIITESGFIYCLFWAFEIVLFIPIPRASRAIYLYEVCTALRNQVSGIYATAIIVIVNLHQTLMDTTALGSKIEFSSKSPANIEFAQTRATNTSSIYELRQPDKEEHSFHSDSNLKTVTEIV